MCGRFRLTRAAKLAERFDIEPEDDWVPRYNIAPTQDIPVIRQHADEPERFGSRMRWGLISSWAKDPSIGYKMINARAETVTPSSRPLDGRSSFPAQESHLLGFMGDLEALHTTAAGFGTVES